MTKVRQIIISLLVLFGLAVAPVLAVGTASAQLGDTSNPIESGLDTGTCLSADQANCTANGVEDAPTRVEQIVRLVINILSWVVGIIAVVMIIIGGLRYITSGGDSGNVTSAKNTILYAIVGLVIVALAQVIVRFVFQAVNPS